MMISIGTKKTIKYFKYYFLDVPSTINNGFRALHYW